MYLLQVGSVSQLSLQLGDPLRTLMGSRVYSEATLPHAVAPLGKRPPCTTVPEQAGAVLDVVVEDVVVDDDVVVNDVVVDEVVVDEVVVDEVVVDEVVVDEVVADVLVVVVVVTVGLH